MDKIVIFDIDGTLADVEHRRQYVRSKPKNFPAFYAAQKHDPIMPRTVDTFNDFVKAGWTIIICTGREGTDNNAEMTINWLGQHNLDYDVLMMRREKDYRSDDKVKREMLECIRKDHGEPFIVFDDRQQVVDMWREEGLIVHQVAQGDF